MDKKPVSTLFPNKIHEVQMRAREVGRAGSTDLQRVAE